jgi:hypothetical protein
MEMKMVANRSVRIKKFNDFADPATLNLIAFAMKIKV